MVMFRETEIRLKAEISEFRYPREKIKTNLKCKSDKIKKIIIIILHE